MTKRFLGVKVRAVAVGEAASSRRHEGFLDRAQILARWKSLGVEL